MKKYKKYNDYELLYLLNWHSEEALYILLDKYDNLIRIKLAKFNVSDSHYADYLQELRMTVLTGIKKYDERYGKSLCRFLELIIERRIARLMYDDSRSVLAVCVLEDTIVGEKRPEVLEEMIYETRIREIKEIKFDDIKKSIFNQVLLKGISIKEYSKLYDISTKEVYNHLYSLRAKVKGKFNL